MTINVHFVRKKANNNLAFLFIVRDFANKFRRMDKQYTEKQEKMARFAKALGHPARIAIMQFLAKQEQCYFGDIHEELPIAKATVSQHLSELKDAGLIQGTIEAPKVRYCINQDNWLLAQELFKDFFGKTACKNKGCCG
ncbi:MAG: winged helix-turn-helix transcriptional regulator [Bacteroidaceae bacterium]|nr:winged helix-turn-helix transcriptional regulator [Bacteroidaceae bacterium]